MQDGNDLKTWTVQQLFDLATEEANPCSVRVAAQDELSRRAYYEQDAKAAEALSPAGLHNAQAEGVR